MTHVWRLSDWDQFAPESRHWWRPTWGDDRKGGDESTVAVAFCGPAVDILTVECPPSRLQIPIRYDLSALAYPRPPEDWRVGDPPSGEVARTPLPRAGLDDLDALRPAADAFLSSICGGAARFTKPSERSG